MPSITHLAIYLYGEQICAYAVTLEIHVFFEQVEYDIFYINK